MKKKKRRGEKQRKGSYTRVVHVMPRYAIAMRTSDCGHMWRSRRGMRNSRHVSPARVLIRVRAVVRQWLIGIDRSRHCATPTSSGREISPINFPLNVPSLPSPPLSVSVLSFSSRKAKYLFFPRPSFYLVNDIFPSWSPKPRALGERLMRKYKGIRRLRNALWNITCQSTVINLSYSLVAIGMII